MSPKTLPRLTESKIRKLATSQSFTRGDRYYQNRSIVNPIRQGLTLWADCQGSQLYQTRVTLSKDGIAATSCTCRYDWGGICKHLVALLLTYVRQPESFYVMPSLEEMLASRSREDLVSLIGQMVQRVPELMSLIELSARSSQGQPIDISVYRRQAQRALRRDDMHEIAEDLEMLCDAANQLLDAGDWLNSGTLYQMLLQETTENYDGVLQSIDYDGEVAGLSQDFAEGLGQCLAQAQELDSLTREVWLTTLLEGALKDIELGGIDFAAGATEHLLEQAT
ncbi:SWIM zinc finger family protein, partial [Allocoleopsis sp.]|uniref:SWIM zinc finger family protein n=1 Tax=Allocoleopsis sp. TaxID=3088169 RepID=UPI002FD593FB